MKTLSAACSRPAIFSSTSLNFARDLFFSTASWVAWSDSMQLANEAGGDYGENAVGPYPKYWEESMVKRTASLTITAPVYKSSWLFMGLAIGVILLSSGAVLPLFNRFWTLDEIHSMSPKETAMVFHQRTGTRLSDAGKTSEDENATTNGNQECKDNGIIVREREVSPS
jgi:hypothetical protein